jgi:Phage integrase family
VVGEVKTEKFSRTEGKTPAFDTEQVQNVLDKIDTSNEVGLRDRALLWTLAYTFARIGAVVNLKVEDYFQTGKRSMIRFREKGGKETEIPVHHKLDELLDQYLEKSGLRNRPSRTPLSDCRRQDAKAREPPGNQNRCSQNAQTPAQDAGLSDAFSPHSLGLRESRISWRMEERWRWPSGLPVMPIVERPNFTTGVGRGFYSKTWSGFGTDYLIYGKLSGKIFVSYRREESRSAIRLCDLLSEHFSRNQIFMGIDSIALDADYVKAIEKTVGECDVLVAVIGPHWLTSDGTLN